MQELVDDEAVKRLLNIDLARYRQNPNESETIKVFSKVINIIRIVDPDTPRTLLNICKEANHILTMINTQIKILYMDLLQPGKLAILALDALAMYACSLQEQLALSSNNMYTEAKDLIERMENLKQRQMAVKIMEEQIKDGKKLIALKHLKENTDIMIQGSKKKLESAKCIHQAQEAKLQKLQHHKDIMEVQLNSLKDKNEALINELKLENSNYNICLGISEKKIMLEELTRKVEALQGAIEGVQPNIVSNIHAKIVKTLKPLIDVLDGELCELEANEELANSLFSTQKKLHNIMRQLKEMECNKFQVSKKCKQEKEANNEIQREISKNQEKIRSFRKKVFNLYKAVVTVTETINQIEDIVRENTKQFHVFNESSSNQCADLQ